MSSNTLVLEPDPVKKRLVLLGLPTIAFVAIGAVMFAVFKDFRVGFMFYLAIGGVIYWSVFRYLKSTPQDSRLELGRDGLDLTLSGTVSFHKWESLSRITLVEQVSEDENGKLHAHSHFLALRFLTSDTENPDSPTQVSNADLLIPIDLYISHHRYSGRTEKQEAACKSALDLANTVNAWRDYALNLEIAAVQTPVVQTRNNVLPDLSLEIYAKLTS
ncbi:hypothetical protein [Roseibium sediminicola]|uniref:Uncharacterized protein n=1 Tax=Roseibium sediminicola TaxID=2933272 RepID=A0ABT0GSK5_9HYPH|nr:hypothetical protein [Roseibium sp. CAU 1639]MCK7612413.1 hypothetical protein [Roseibium sp. CAU 1639]